MGRRLTHTVLTFLLTVTSLPNAIVSFSAVSTKSTSALLADYADNIKTLKDKAKRTMDNPPGNDVFYLRYCLAFPDDIPAQKERLEANLEWRSKGIGKSICESAELAILTANADKLKWNNEPLRVSAPYAPIINGYITPNQSITTTSSKGDLIYCVRAGKIDDVELMSQLDVDQMVEFFLYCKEVNAQVADMRSLTMDRLVRVITANDLSGVKLVGGDATFRKALSAASTQANDLYPALSGPTLLLNLPPLVGALVKVFTPLFPPAVRKKLKFEKGVLAKNMELTDYLVGGKGRKSFEQDIDDLVYKFIAEE